MKLEKNFNCGGIITSDLLRLGEMMELRMPKEICNEHIVLKTFNAIVSLSNPQYTWSHSTACLEGRKLLPGDSVTLTQE